MNTPQVLGLIPARAGSKGIANKNMKTLDGKPLIQYTLEAALTSDLLNVITVSTDSPEIVKFVSQFPGIQAPFVRPIRIAGDTSPTISAVFHALQFYAERNIHFDYVVLLQPTSPFRNEKLIDECIREIVATDADSLVTVRQVPHRYNPDWTFSRNEQGILTRPGNISEMIQRRQDLPAAFYRDGKVYVSKASLIYSGTLLGGKIGSIVTALEPDVNIDTIGDWDEAHKQMIRWKAGLRNPF